MDILIGLGNKKTYKYSKTQKYNRNCVAMLHDKTFLQLSENGNSEIIFKNSLEPLIPYTSSNINDNVLERFIILISGTSGDGKSLLASLFVTQFMKMHDNRKIFRISMKPIENDRNFSKFKNIINVELDDLEEIETIADIPKDCLFIIDDCDKQKEVYRVLNLLGEHGRESGINLIFITHYNSRVNDSSIYKECLMYITFHTNINNNRMLTTHFKLTEKQLTFLKALNQTLYIFNKTNQTIICNNFVCKLNSLEYDKQDQAEIIELLN
jgi:ABC-type dipeptide/oligopeptide/nickel transport system ATPase subunit